MVLMLQMGSSTLTVPAGEKRFKESLPYTGNELFRLLDYRWLSGDARTALSPPNTVVLTRANAEKYFGTPKAVGKRIGMTKGVQQPTGPAGRWRR